MSAFGGKADITTTVLGLHSRTDRGVGTGVGSASAASRLSFDFVQSAPKRVNFGGGGIDAIL
jgi:hypothetical protein